MSLFTSTTFNNGAAHVFSYVGQITEGKSMVGKYVEVAAPSDAQVQLYAKQDMSSKTLKRSLLQYKIWCANNEGIYEPITVNYTTVNSKKHLAADVVLAQKLVGACLADASFHTNFQIGLI
jgi:hypothetical protein